MQMYTFILSVKCSICFGWSLHPSSGAQITVFTASGTSQPLLLPVGMVEELRLSNGLLVPDAVNTVIRAPDDGWRNHPKHVQQFTDKINPCTVTSCWIFIDTELRCEFP